MHKINKLLKEITDELWAIKHYESEIEFKDIVDFYKEYQFHKGLAVDVINAQIIQYDGDAAVDMPISEDDITYMIEAFSGFNKNNYDRLIAELLFVLDNEQSYQYLNRILDTDEKRLEFKREFSRWHHFERTKEELRKLGNNI